MRILMLADFYRPFIGGVAQHVRDLGGELVRRGHDVAVATLWSPGLPDLEVDEGLRIYRLRGSMQRARWLYNDPRKRWTPPFPDPELTLALRHVIAAEQPAIVHGHTWLVHSFLPLKVWSGAKLVLSLHEYGIVCAKKSPVYRGAVCSGPSFRKCLSCAVDHYGVAKGIPAVLGVWAMKPALRAAVDMYLPVSRTVAAGTGLTGSGLPFQVMPNFIAAKAQATAGDADPHLAQLPPGPFLLFVGAISRHKGVDVLLRAYADLDGAVPLVLIGAPWPDAPAEYPANVTVLTNWPHEAIMAAWRRCLLALIPSVVPEALPLVAIEAITSGLPIVASRIGSLGDLVADGENGLLVPPGDPVALRQAMQSLLTDPSLRERMGRAAREKAVEFQASRVVPRIEQVYRQVQTRAA